MDKLLQLQLQPGGSLRPPSFCGMLDCGTCSSSSLAQVKWVWIWLELHPTGSTVSPVELRQYCIIIYVYLSRTSDVDRPLSSQGIFSLWIWEELVQVRTTNCPTICNMSHSTKHVANYKTCSTIILYNMSHSTKHVPQYETCPTIWNMSHSTKHVPHKETCPIKWNMSHNMKHVAVIWKVFHSMR